MKIANITSKINELLAGEMLSQTDLLPFMDEVIDEINETLDSTFPVMSEVIESGKTDYDFFPDRYVRTVLIKGTAYKFYLMDEEGIQTAQQYGYNYIDAMFTMQRDYLEDVPEEYKAVHQSSVVGLSDVAYIDPWVRGVEL